MESTRKAKTNALLRHQRLLRGWSLKQVVDQLCTLCDEEEDIPGITADMVSKWERGERKPSPFYQQRLCLLYSVTADQLGFIEIQDRPESFQGNDTHSVFSTPTFVPRPSASTKTIDALLETEKEEASEVLATHLLSLSGKQLATLTTLGWTQQDILRALHIVLQGETAMVKMNRRQVFQLGAGMLLLSGGITFPTHEHPSIEERTDLAKALEESIVAGWTLFHTAGTAQVLAVSKSQLTLVQQAHSILYPGARPFLYSGAHRLMGAALYFQGRYKEALYAHDQGYNASLATNDAWNIAQSLSWQAYVHQEDGQYAQAVQAIEEAVRLIDHQSDEMHLRLKAHLLACWAENAVLLQEHTLAMKKLDASEALLDCISANEEFDRAQWLQQAGNCALTTKDYRTAIHHYEEALHELPPHWTLRHAVTLVPLAIAYARSGKRDKSLAIAEKAVPVLGAMNAQIMNNQFVEYIQEDLLGTFPGDTQIQKFVAETQRRLPQLRC